MPEPKTTVLEIWKPIPSTNELYDASNLGRVRSWFKQKIGIGGKLFKTPPKVLSPGRMPNGYLIVIVRSEGYKPKTGYIHRLVMEAFCGPCPEGQQVNHRNGDRADNRLANLEYVTKSENCLHSYRVLGRIAAVRDQTGELNAAAKFTNAQAIEIREAVLKARNTGVWGARAKIARELAKQYGVKEATILAVGAGRNWKHISTNIN